MSANPTAAPHEPARTLKITEQALCAWFGKATPDDSIEYHRGHLLIDRSRKAGPLCEKDRRELSGVANRALALAEEGRLHLVQKRHGDFDYSYLAIIARCPPKRQTTGR